ncbi:hypothetical protein Rctr71_003 [Virus Rctr71]|nr:hypothetical protein Rctr71_003 [Virus Rctr71]
MLKSIEISVTTDADGDGVKTQGLFGVNALLVAVEWVKGTFADGVDATLLCVNTRSGVNNTLLTLTNANANAMKYPRVLEHGSTGSDLATHTMPVINGDLRLSIAEGGNVKTGSCIVYYVD